MLIPTTLVPTKAQPADSTRSRYVKMLLVLTVLTTLNACLFEKPTPSLHVDITSFLGDNQAFYQDDELSFLMSLNEDAWLYMFYQNAEGKVYQLIPSILYPDNEVLAGDFLPFPTGQARFKLHISEPFGEEKVWLIASTQDLGKHADFNRDLDELNTPLETLRNSILKKARKKSARVAEDTLHFSSKPYSI